jgi:hypothetical protein
MAVELDAVRIELQLSKSVISDDSVEYVINKLSEYDDINLVCAEVLRMVLRKHRGLAVRRIGKYYEEINPVEIRRLINEYMGKAATVAWDDGFIDPDAWFTREGI